MVPPSGTGVVESLALAHAPFTMMTPVGTFCCSVGLVLVEKSPPFWAALRPTAANATRKARTTEQRENPQRIWLLWFYHHPCNSQANARNRYAEPIALHSTTFAPYEKHSRPTFCSRPYAHQCTKLL